MSGKEANAAVLLETQQSMPNREGRKYNLRGLQEACSLRDLISERVVAQKLDCAAFGPGGWLLRSGETANCSWTLYQHAHWHETWHCVSRARACRGSALAAQANAEARPVGFGCASRKRMCGLKPALRTTSRCRRRGGRLMRAC